MKNILLFDNGNLLFKGLVPFIEAEPLLSIDGICIHQNKLFTILLNLYLDIWVISHDQLNYFDLLPKLKKSLSKLAIVHFSNGINDKITNKQPSTVEKFIHQLNTIVYE